jgi:hypothetical protein
MNATGKRRMPASRPAEKIAAALGITAEQHDLDARHQSPLRHEFIQTV